MTTLRKALGLLLLVGFCLGAAAATEPAKILDVEGKVLDIIGVARGVEGVLQDLGAKVVGQEIVIELSADVLFDFDKAGLKPVAVDSLTKVAAVLKGMPASPATVDGHTDGKGDAPYNQNLSARRANSVRDWLVKLGGVPAARLTARGFGMSHPVAPNANPDGSDNPKGRQLNRRVEIRVRKS
jgi:outer membrane protein OmpA-like peptidoglycan-associated protein